MILKFKKMRAEARIPSFGHDDPMNAGLDLYLAEGKAIMSGMDAWLPSGVAWEAEIPPTVEVPISEMIDRIDHLKGWKPALLIRPRSSMAKLGLEITEGTIDASYRGEIMIHVRNVGPGTVRLGAEDRIAQIIPILVPHVTVEEVYELSPSIRGDKGFGSSGR